MDPENEGPTDTHDTNAGISQDFGLQDPFEALNNASLNTEIRYKRYFFRYRFLPFLESHSRQLCVYMRMRGAYLILSNRN